MTKRLNLAYIDQLTKRIEAVTRKAVEVQNRRERGEQASAGPFVRQLVEIEDDLKRLLEASQALEAGNLRAQTFGAVDLVNGGTPAELRQDTGNLRKIQEAADLRKREESDAVWNRFTAQWLLSQIAADGQVTPDFKGQQEITDLRKAARDLDDMREQLRRLR